MDGAIFAWIFIFLFLIFYSSIHMKKCFAALRAQNAALRTSTFQIQQRAIYTIGDNSLGRNRNNFACNIPLPPPPSYSDITDINFIHIPSEVEKERNDGLPSYEEVTAQDRNSQQRVYHNTERSRVLNTNIPFP